MIYIIILTIEGRQIIYDVSLHDFSGWNRNCAFSDY